MIKKISALVLAITISACALTGCSSGKESSSANDNNSNVSGADSTGGEPLETFDPNDSTAETEKSIPEASLTIDGKKIDTSKLTVCTIDGVKIDFDTFRYYFFSTYTVMAQSSADVTADSVKEQTIERLKQKVEIEKLAKENNCELTKAEIKEKVTDSISTIKSQFTNEEQFQQALASQYMTEAVYKDMLKNEALSNKVTEKLFKNEGKYATSFADFRKIVQDSSLYARELHVMIPPCAMVELDDSDAKDFDSKTLTEKIQLKYSAYSQLDEKEQEKAKEKAKEKAEEVLKKAQNGEDFTQLVKDYGWDVTIESNLDGLYLNKDIAEDEGYPKVLVDGTFNTKVGEVHDKVEEDDTYGYFVIKRLDIDMDYVNKNIADLTFEYDNPKISETIEKLMKNMKVSYCKYWDKITLDSIT